MEICHKIFLIKVGSKSVIFSKHLWVGLQFDLSLHSRTKGCKTVEKSFSYRHATHRELFFIYEQDGEAEGKGRAGRGAKSDTVKANFYKSNLTQPYMILKICRFLPHLFCEQKKKTLNTYTVYTFTLAAEYETNYLES